MLKTNIENPAQPDGLTIATGILKGYINNPNIFMWRLRFRVLRVKNRINKNIPDDISRLLALSIAMYSLFRESLETEQALKLLNAVIIPVGLISQMSLFRYVEVPDHSFENLVTASKRFKKEGPMRLNKMEIVEETDDTYKFRVKNCIFKSVFEQFECTELLGIFCSVDNATYNTYAADDIVFSRGGNDKTIARGHKTCDFICQKVQS
jgi:hypothetical protein